MTIARWTGGSPLTSFFDEALEEFSKNAGRLWKSSPDSWRPLIDIVEEDNSFSITAEVPGMNKDDIDIEVVDNSLTIRGERKWESENSEGRTFHRVERAYGRFERSFYLPDNVDTENIKAVFKDGLLSLTIPKIEEQKTSRKIEIGGE